MPILNIFPTPVWTDQLPEGVVRRLDRALSGLTESRAPAPADLQGRPELAAFLKCASAAAAQVLDALRIDHHGFLITGCWAEIVASDGLRPRRSQANNFLSGLYVARLSGGRGRISFHDPRAQTAVYRPRLSAENHYNRRVGELTLEEGLLLLFPAWLDHGIERPDGDGRHICLAFNVMFEQFGERMAPPRW